MNDLSILSFEQGQSALLQLDLNLQRDFRFKFLSVADQRYIEECSSSYASAGVRLDFAAPGRILIDLLKRLFPQIPVFIRVIFDLADNEFSADRDLCLGSIRNVDQIFVGFEGESAFFIQDRCCSDNCGMCNIYALYMPLFAYLLYAFDK